ncbi:MAG: radical SAM protein [Thermodesulfobacteriota bacterium]
MLQPVREFFNRHGQTVNVLGRLLLFRQIDIRRLAGVPVNLLASLFNRPPPLPPPVIQVDITDMCNLRCPGCLTGMGWNNGHQGMMPYETFASLIDEVARYTALAVLYNSGEPLLHTAAVDMIRLLTANAIASIISTNGHFVRTPAEAEALVASGLSVMVVSLSGATQETYAHYHRGGRLDQVLSGVRHVRQARKTLKKKTPLIIFRFLVMDHNRHETKAMTAMAKKEGCDWFELREVRWRACPPGIAADSDGQRREPPRRAKGRKCLWPWLISVVNWNGDIYPCCFFRLNMARMGRTTDPGGLKAVWKNNDYNRFRGNMRSGNGRPDACRGCPAETGFQTRFSRQQRTIHLHLQAKPGTRADI